MCCFLNVKCTSKPEKDKYVPDYIDENVSTKVVKIIQSYVVIVNKMVWRKEQ